MIHPGVCRTQRRQTPKAKPAAVKRRKKDDQRATLARFSCRSTASGVFDLHFRPVLLLAACRTLESDRLVDLKGKVAPGAQAFLTLFPSAIWTFRQLTIVHTRRNLVRNDLE